METSSDNYNSTAKQPLSSPLATQETTPLNTQESITLTPQETMPLTTQETITLTQETPLTTQEMMTLDEETTLTTQEMMKLDQETTLTTQETMTLDEETTLTTQEMMTLDQETTLTTQDTDLIPIKDTLSNIFLRLPLRSIRRFSSACKFWRSILTDPFFHQLWRKHNFNPPTGLFLRTNDGEISNVLVPLSPNKIMPNASLYKYLKIDQSCYGFLFCKDRAKYYVFNPTNGSKHVLPRQSGEVSICGRNKAIQSVVLVYDPKRFGDNYKVFCVVGSCLHVYSSFNRMWDLIPFQFDDGVVNGQGVYWNGCIHWVLTLRYFDISNTLVNRMPEPPIDLWRQNYYFGESGDRLVYAKHGKGGGLGKTRLLVYSLNRDYSEWNLIHNVEFDYEPTADTSILSIVIVSDEGGYVVFKKWTKVVMFDLVTNVGVELSTKVSTELAFQYMETGGVC